MNLPAGVTGYALMGLGVALAASVATNLALGHLYLGKRDELARVATEAANSASAQGFKRPRSSLRPTAGLDPAIDSVTRAGFDLRL